MQILICCPYTFPIEVVGKICSTTFTFCERVLNFHDHSGL